MLKRITVTIPIDLWEDGGFAFDQTEVAQAIGKKLNQAHGRPRDLDYEEVNKLWKKGLTLREIAQKLKVTHGAVAYALGRVKKGKKK